MSAERFFQYLLFPGIILHEMAHAFACLILNVPIKKIKWIGKEGGYVVHEKSNSHKTIIIALFPFLFNIFISLLFARFYLLNQNIYIKILSAWIALSALFFCTPSDQDVNNCLSCLKNTYKKKQSSLKLFLKIILFPLPLSVYIICKIFKILDKYIIFRVILIVLWIYLFMI